MAGFSMRLTLDSTDVQTTLDGVVQRLQHLQPVLEDMRERLLRSVQQNFIAGGRPTPWPPSRRARSGRGRTLVDTARLQNSITGRIEGRSVILGTNVAYARIHQQGGTIQTPEIRPRRKRALRFQIGDRTVFATRVRGHAVRLPARPFLLVQAADEQYIRRVLTEYLTEGR
jgi:phage virion morphogenesis protein